MSDELMRDPPSRLIGTSEIWRDHGTGTRVFWLLWMPLHRHDFFHSTAILD
jgi:hypothetical protein